MLLLAFLLLEATHVRRAEAATLFPEAWLEQPSRSRLIVGLGQIWRIDPEANCAVGAEPWRAMALVAHGFLQCDLVSGVAAAGIAPEVAFNPDGVGILDQARPGATPFAVLNAPLFFDSDEVRFFARISYKFAPVASRASRQASHKPGYSPFLWQAWLDALDSGFATGLLWQNGPEAEWRFSYSQTIPRALRVAGALAQTTLLETRQVGVQWRGAFGRWRLGTGLWAVALRFDDLLIEFPMPDAYFAYEF